MTLADFSKAALFACLFPGFLLLGADETAPTPLRRLTIGIHVMYFPTAPGEHQKRHHDY